ncbi:U32 family peptidase C-terminal domain-containing protein [Halopseudomonas aestusnigri]|uniref:U32 family peptidase C-terminal domain-containing protein n=1 Tax=Halopseudomonas aestusnigri TaxID=857252 RepID=UPI0035717528
MGDQLELMTPQGNHSFVLEALQDRHGSDIEVAPGNGHRVRIPRPPLTDLRYALLMRWLAA